MISVVHEVPAVLPRMRVLSWNIRHGGGSRCSQIVTAILGHEADVVVLTEVRRSSAMLNDALATAGWTHQAATPLVGNANGVVVLGRSPLEVVDAGMPDRLRWVEVVVPTAGVRIAATHLWIEKDSRDAEWEAVLTRAATIFSEPTLIIGDLNTGMHCEDEAGATFSCSRHMRRLIDAGWLDAWRKFHPGEREFTWFSTRGGKQLNGFRIDHAFVSPSLTARVEACDYSHQERVSGASDHSALVVSIGR